MIGSPFDRCEGCRHAIRRVPTLALGGSIQVPSVAQAALSVHVSGRIDIVQVHSVIR